MDRWVGLRGKGQDSTYKLGLGFRALNWFVVKECHLSSHNEETILFTMDPCYGNLN